MSVAEFGSFSIWVGIDVYLVCIILSVVKFGSFSIWVRIDVCLGRIILSCLRCRGLAWVWVLGLLF